MEPEVEEAFDLNVKFTNMLDVRMTECALFVEGPGIQKHKKIHIK